MVKSTEIKKEIRKRSLGIREQIGQEERKRAEEKITEQILSSRPYRDVCFLYCYVSYGSEPDTRRLIDESLRQRKRVAVPRVTGKHKMDFCFIRSLADLSPGYRGISEPGPWCRKAPVPSEKTLVIVPGLAFDRGGGRIGYGGGFYDAYLERQSRCIKAAAAFSAQITDEVPSESSDVKMDMIITEKEMIVCSQYYREIR